MIILMYSIIPENMSEPHGWKTEILLDEIRKSQYTKMYCKHRKMKGVWHYGGLYV